MAETDTEKLDQKVTLSDTGPARKTLTLEIPEKRIQASIEEAYGSLRDDAVLPGFRKGRAPRRLLEKRFATSLREDVKRRLLSESYAQAIDEHGLDVIGEPELLNGDDDFELPESGDLKLELDIEVAPEVELPEFDTLKIDRPSAEVADSDIDEEIERVAERYGSMQPVADATFAEGDYVQADVTIRAGQDAGDDAEVISTSADVWTLVHGEKNEFKGHIAGILIPDLGKQLTGKKVGDTITVSMDGPPSHEDEKIKGQPITIVIDTKECHRLEPLTRDALIERIGVETEDELKERVRENLEQRKQAESDTAVHKQIAEQLVEKTKLELPEGLKGRQIERVIERQRMEMLYQGSSEDEVEAKLAEARSDSESAAIEQLKAFFVVDAAAKKLDIEVTQQEINQRIVQVAMQQQRRPDKVARELQERGQIEQLYLSIREQKTLDQIAARIEGTADEAAEGDDASA